MNNFVHYLLLSSNQNALFYSNIPSIVISENIPKS